MMSSKEYLSQTYKSTDVQDALANLSARYSMAQNAAGFGIWDWDIVNDCITCDQKIFHLYGIKEDKRKPRFKDWSAVVHPADKVRIEEEIQSAIDGKSKFDTRFRISRPDGEIRMIRALAEVYKNEDKTPINLIGTNWDITPEYHKTQALEKSEQVLKEAQEISNFGNFDYDLINEKIDWSDQMYVIYDRNKEEEFTFEMFQELIHKDDVGRFNERFEKAIFSKESIEIEHRIITSLGNEKIVCQKARIYYDLNDSPIRVIGTTRDVSSERQLEYDLKRNLTYQKMLTEISHQLNQLDQFDHMIDLTLKTIGSGLGLSKAFIYQEDPFNSNFFPKNSWINPNYQCNPMKLISYFQLGPIKEVFKRNEFLRNLDDLPMQIQNDLRNDAERSILLFPIYLNHKFCGIVGFEDHKKGDNWNESDLNFLKTAYQLIANAFKQWNFKAKLIESEAKYKDLYNRTPAKMYVIDPNIKILNASEYLLDKMGYTVDELLGEEITKFMTEKSHKVFKDQLYPAFMKNGECKNVPMQYVKKSGEVIEVLMSAICEKDDWGTLLKISVIIIDVSKERAVEQAMLKLNESLESKVKIRTAELEKISQEMISQRNLMESFINITPSMIYLKDKEGKYQIVNKMFKELFGLEKENVIGKTDFELFPEDFAKEFVETDQAVVKSKSVIESEDLLMLDQISHNYLSVKFPLKDSEGNVTSIGGVSTDITLRKKQEEKMRFQAEELRVSNEILKRQQEQLKRSQKQLISVNEELESFSYSVSHDLRAPLRALEGFSHLLSTEYEDKLDDRGKNWLNFINTNTIKMDSLIKNILEFSRISRYKINKLTIDTKLMVNEIINEELSNYKEKEIRIHAENLVSSYVDPRIFKQVWVNLISNALKYSSKKDVIEITIESIDLGNMVEFSIQDNGAGFDEKYIGKLFGVFQRLHKEGDFKGTGVGLAIVKKIVNRHGGEIRAESTVDNGAKFTFNLPKE